MENGLITANEEDEVYTLTLKGLLVYKFGDDNKAQSIIDCLELHMRRFYAKDGYPAIILEDNNLVFKTVVKGKENEG